MLSHHPNFGNLKRYDTSEFVNTAKMHKSFLAMPCKTARTVQTARFVNGGLSGGRCKYVAPESWHNEYEPSDWSHFERILDLFVWSTKPPFGDPLFIQAERTVCNKRGVAPIDQKLTDWDENNMRMVGMICIGRENVMGGIHQFRAVHKPDDVLYSVLHPGHMVVFGNATRDPEVEYKLGEIKPKTLLLKGLWTCSTFTRE